MQRPIVRAPATHIVHSTSRTYRKSTPAFLIAIVFLAGVTTTGCKSSSNITIDLINELPNAERRAAGDVAVAIRPDRAGPPDDERPSLLMTAPARVVWSLRFPARAHLKTAVRLVPTGAAPDHGVTA